MIIKLLAGKFYIKQFSNISLKKLKLISNKIMSLVDIASSFLAGVAKYLTRLDVIMMKLVEYEALALDVPPSCRSSLRNLVSSVARCHQGLEHIAAELGSLNEEDQQVKMDLYSQMTEANACYHAILGVIYPEMGHDGPED